MTLDETPLNQEVKVTKIHGEGPLKKRIMEMGITRGSSIIIIKEAPLKDPIEVTIRGYNLSLRRSEAKQIDVEVA